MTNREAWKKGYEHGFKGLHPRPDYPLVGLAGSYRLGYEAGYKRRKEPKGPKQNPGFLSHAIAKHKVKQARKRVQAEIARVRNRIAELEQEVIEYRHGPIWKGDARAKQWAAQASLKVQKLRAIEKKLVRGLEELPVINPRRNGIIEAAAGLQALDYFGGKAKKAGLGKTPKINPNEARFLLQIVTASGKREQFTTNTEKQAREIAASWYSRGASVTVVDRKNKTQTVYGKKNPRGSRDVLGVFHAENPSLVAETKDNIRSLKKVLAGKTVRGLKLGDVGITREWATRSLRAHQKLLELQRKTARVGKTIRGRKNPSVTDLSRTFQGKADGSVERMHAAQSAPANLARAGKLVFLKTKHERGIGSRTWRVPGAVVTIAPNEKLWIVGDHAPLFKTKARSGQGLDVGEVTHICYETAKAHIGNGKTFEYVHEFGEDGGKRPHLIIDSEGMPILRGGDYKIRAEGIVD